MGLVKPMTKQKLTPREKRLLALLLKLQRKEAARSLCRMVLISPVLAPIIFLELLESGTNWIAKKLKLNYYIDALANWAFDPHEKYEQRRSKDVGRMLRVRYNRERDTARDQSPRQT